MRILLTTCLFVLAFCLFGQSYESRIHYKVRLGDPEQLHQLILLDYTKLLGKALDVTADSIYFQLRNAAELSVVPINQLRYLGIFSQELTGSGGRPYAGRVGLSDMTIERTALPYQTKARLKVVQLLYTVTEWNLNKNIQLGVGLLGPIAFIATQKLRFTVAPDVHVGLSNQIGFPPFGQGFNEGKPLLVGDVHALLTIGNEDRFFNLGTGYFYNTDIFTDGARNHRIGIGGKLDSKWHLYSEALILLNDDDGRFRSFRELVVIPSLNAALSVRSHRWQFGLATFFVDQNDIFPPPIPYVGYTYYWGNR
jgi:hypothetical protein